VPVVSTPRYVILCGLDPVSWYFTPFPPVSPPPRRFKCNYLYAKVSYSEYKTNTSFHRKKSDPKVIIHVDSKNIFTPNKLYTTEHKIPLKKLFELLFKRYYPGWPSHSLSLSVYLCLSISLSLSLSLPDCQYFIWLNETLILRLDPRRTISISLSYLPDISITAHV